MRRKNDLTGVCAWQHPQAVPIHSDLSVSWRDAIFCDIQKKDVWVRKSVARIHANGCGSMSYARRAGAKLASAFHTHNDRMDL